MDYSVLGLSPDATLDSVKTAYRKLASQHHPDRGGSVEIFHKISAAYDNIIKPKMPANSVFGGKDCLILSDIYYTLQLTVEEIYYPYQKIIEYPRLIDGKQVVGRIEFKKGGGWTEKTYVYEGKGNKVGFDRSNLIVQIVYDVSKESTYKIINNNDLVSDIDIPLVNAFYGYLFSYQHINGKTMSIMLSGQIRDNSFTVLEGLGLPYGNSSGNLILQFHCIYPSEQWLRQNEPSLKKTLGFVPIKDYPTNTLFISSEQIMND